MDVPVPEWDGGPLRVIRSGKDERPFPYSDIDDGIQGLKFIEACLKSQEDGNVWTQV